MNKDDKVIAYYHCFDRCKGTYTVTEGVRYQGKCGDKTAYYCSKSDRRYYKNEYSFTEEDLEQINGLRVDFMEGRIFIITLNENLDVKELIKTRIQEAKNEAVKKLENIESVLLYLKENPIPY